MRFVTYHRVNHSSHSQIEPTERRVGLLVDHSPNVTQKSLIDIQQGLKWLSETFHQGEEHENKNKSGQRTNDFLGRSLDMLQIIEQYEQLQPRLQALLNAHREHRLPSSMIFSEKDVQLDSPIPRPLSVRDGYAFRQHVEAARRNRGVPMIPEFDQFPVFYFTNALAITGPGDILVKKQAREKLDFELEVAVVIGKECKNISASEADSVIFGFMIMNDWSARALQMEEMKLNLGPAKGKDFATSLGPYLVTRDELQKFAISGKSGERHQLRMKAYVNGQLLSDGYLNDMTWTFAQIIERASYGVTLYPGEVIGSGTVGTGCLLELNGSKITHDLWLKPGDQVVMEVDELGRLENRIVAAD